MRGPSITANAALTFRHAVHWNGVVAASLVVVPVGRCLLSLERETRKKDSWHGKGRELCESHVRHATHRHLRYNFNNTARQTLKVRQVRYLRYVEGEQWTTCIAPIHKNTSVHCRAVAARTFVCHPCTWQSHDSASLVAQWSLLGWGHLSLKERIETAQVLLTVATSSVRLPDRTWHTWGTCPKIWNTWNAGDTPKLKRAGIIGSGGLVTREKFNYCEENWPFVTCWQCDVQAKSSRLTVKQMCVSQKALQVNCFLSL